MAGEIEVIGIEVGHRQRYNTRITPKKAHWAAHKENGLDYVASGVEDNESAGDPQRRPLPPKDHQERKHHEIDAAR